MPAGMLISRLCKCGQSPLQDSRWSNRFAHIAHALCDLLYKVLLYESFELCEFGMKLHEAVSGLGFYKIQHLLDSKLDVCRVQTYDALVQA